MGPKISVSKGLLLNLRIDKADGGVALCWCAPFRVSVAGHYAMTSFFEIQRIWDAWPNIRNQQVL
jgi:hypothetical protein